MGSSVPAAIDYLIGALTNGVQVQTAPGRFLTIPPLSAIDPTVVVSDNEPLTSSETQAVIGRASPTSAAAGDINWAYSSLGQGRMEEQYTLPGYLAVWRPGPQQKPARDAVWALGDAVVHLIHADPTLGGLLQYGRIARLSRVAFHQTQDDEDTAGGGYMLACIDFELEVSNSYIP